MAWTLHRCVSFENQGSQKLSSITGLYSYANTNEPDGRYYIRLEKAASGRGVARLTAVPGGGSGDPLANGTIVGFRFYIESFQDAGNWQFCRIGASDQITMEFNASHQIVISTGLGGAVQTIATPITTGTWYDFEIHVGVWGSSGGDFEAFLNGVGQGQQTSQTFGSTNPSYVYFEGAVNAVGGTIDLLDFYVGDGAASANDRMSYDDGNGTTWSVLALNAGTGATTGGDAPDSGTLFDAQEILGNDATYAQWNPFGTTAWIRTDGTGAYTGPSGRTGIGVPYGINGTWRARRSGGPGGAQYLAPDAIITQTNLSGSVGDIDESPASPDANWLIASGVPVFRCSFPTPTYPVNVSANSEIRVAIRAQGAAGGGTQALPPDAIITQTNLSGTVATIDDDPDSPSGDWMTAADNNTNSVLITSFGTPSGNPTTGAGLQNFKIYARLTANGTACTYNVYLRNSSGRLNGGVAIATGSLTSTTGQLITATWNASLLSNPDGSDVQLEFEVIKSGGSPANRTTGEVDAVEWNCQWAPAEPVINYSLQLYESGSPLNPPAPVTGSIKQSDGTVLQTLSFLAGDLLDPTGAGVECYLTQTNDPGAYLEIGAVDFYAMPALGSAGLNFQIGNNTDGMSTVGSVPTFGTAFSNYFATSNSASVLATASEYAQIGVNTASDFYFNLEVAEMWLDVLRKPGSGGGVSETEGSSAGTSTAAGVSGAYIKTEGAAAGVAAATGVAGATIGTEGAAAGLATAAADAAGVLGAEGSADGTSTADAVSGVISCADGNADGAATVDGQSGVYAQTEGAAAGVAEATGVSGVVFPTEGLAAGSSTAIAYTPNTIETEGSAAGSSSAAADAAMVLAAAGSSDGVGAVTGVGAGIGQAEGSAAGLATATGVSGALIETVGTADGTSSVTGEASGILESFGSADGIAVVAAYAAALFPAEGSSDGVGAVAGAGAGVRPSEGAASGLATVDGVSGATAGTTGSADGVATADGVSGATIGTSGTAAGVATVDGHGTDANAFAGEGLSEGVATVAGYSAHIFATEGVAACSSAAAADSATVSQTAGAAAGSSVASGEMATVIPATGTAAGAATVTGSSGVVFGTTGLADGSATVDAYAAIIWLTDTTMIAQATTSADSGAIRTVVGFAAGVATVNGYATDAAIGTEGLSEGSSTVVGYAATIQAASGAADGAATATGVMAFLEAVSGLSAGTGAVTGVSGAIQGVYGTAAGVAAGAGVSAHLFATEGLSEGVATALGNAMDASNADRLAIALMTALQQAQVTGVIESNQVSAVYLGNTIDAIREN